jgi:pyruvate formate lyase activating enzyme
MIFDIQRFSTHDGAGIRTIIFFKGCTLRCAWCENPESQSFGYELAYDDRKCICCLDCMQLARDGEIELESGRPRLHRERMRNPEKFARVCPTGALTVIGKDRSIAEIVAEIRKDLPFFRKSGGGVTLSGGEPYDQPAFLLDLLRALEALGLKAAVETSLSAPWTAIESSLPFVETILADVKHADAEKLKAFTGGNFSLIIGNLRRLEKSGTPVIVRVPLVPGFNDGLSEVSDILTLASSLGNVREIHFLPFHTLGVGKYRLLAKEYRFIEKTPYNVDMSRYLDLARSMGLEAIAGG